MSGHKKKINGYRIPKISAHPTFFTTDTKKSEKVILRVILREKSYEHACLLNFIKRSEKYE